MVDGVVPPEPSPSLHAEEETVSTVEDGAEESRPRSKYATTLPVDKPDGWDFRGGHWNTVHDEPLLDGGRVSNVSAHALERTFRRRVLSGAVALDLLQNAGRAYEHYGLKLTGSILCLDYHIRECAKKDGAMDATADERVSR